MNILSQAYFSVKNKVKGPMPDWLFVLWAGGTALLSYSLVYALRKPFTAAEFEGLQVCGMGTLAFLGANFGQTIMPTTTWLFLQSLCLDMAYLSFQTIFFERFIACFKIKGNVGFFIITIDFVGYLGTLGLLLFKEFYATHIDWASFYNYMSLYIGIACCLAFIGSLIYMVQEVRKYKQVPPSAKTGTDNGNIYLTTTAI